MKTVASWAKWYFPDLDLPNDHGCSTNVNRKRGRSNFTPDSGRKA